MRTYLRNSPQAATRIVVLAMLADGHPCGAELAVLERLGAHARLGLTRHELQAVVQAFCEDRLACTDGMSWLDICLMETDPLQQMLHEIDEPALRSKVMALCLSLVEADSQVTDKEVLLLAAMRRQWGLQPEPALALH